MGDTALVRCKKCRLANEAGRAECIACKEPLPKYPGTARAATTKMTLESFQARVAARVEPAPEPRERTFLDGAEPAPPPAPVPPAPVAWLACEAMRPIALHRGKTVRVGRSESNDLVLPHTEVSRVHALLNVMKDELCLEDQRSSNGCYVNGVRAGAREAVKVGDEIAIGPYKIRIRADRGDDSPAETAP